MKFAKKMMLVEAPVDSTKNNQPAIVFQSNDPEQYLRSNTIPNLDSELKETLYRTDLSDREKWLKYNQTLRKFLFFLNQEKLKHSFNSQLEKYSPLNRAPVLNSKPQIKHIFDPPVPVQKGLTLLEMMVITFMIT